MTGLPLPRTDQRAARFLGSRAAAGGPFALLGLDPRRVDDAAIIVALEDQLEQINRHPHAETHEADEIRLALHAAAAQLLDPAVRAEMIARWADAPVPTMPGPEPARSAPPRTPAMVALEHDAILAMAMFGGWNQHSLRRVIMLAHARGIPSHEVAQAIRSISSRRRPRPAAESRPSGTPAQPPPPARSLPDALADRPPTPEMPQPAADPVLAPPPRHSVRTALAAVGVGTIAIAVALGALIMLVPGRASPAPTQLGSSAKTAASSPPSPTPSAAAPDQAAASSKPEVTTPDKNLDARTMIQAIASAKAQLKADPHAAGDRVQRVIEALSLSWPKLTPDERLAIHAGLIDFLYSASPWPEVASSTANAIASGAGRLDELSTAPSADAVRAVVWSAGMLTRLSRERDLPTSIASPVDAALVSAFGGATRTQDRTFKAGAIDMLVQLPAFLERAPTMPATLPRPQSPWAAWIEAVVAVSPGDSSLIERVILGGLDQLLRDGPEPTDNASIHDAVTRMVNALSWAADGEARRWLVRIFDAPAYSAADLHVVTSALILRGGPLGLDLTMTMGPHASELLRRDLRDRYARVWGLTRDSETDILDEDFALARDNALSRARSDLTPLEHFTTAAILARLNTASALSWRGQIDQAQDILDNLNDPAEQVARVDASAVSSFLDFQGGQWAVRYLHVGRNIQARLALLGEVAPGGRLGVVDAEVITAEAVRGNHAKVRAAARELVQFHLDDPATVNALLEELPDLPPTRANIELIEYVTGTSLPPQTDASWQIDARRALVEHLLTLVAAQSDLAAIDRLAEVLAEAYSQRVGSDLASSSGALPPADLLAGVLRSRWARSARSSVPAAGLDSSPGEIERQRLARIAIARGAVERFAIEQLAVCELMAFVVAAEQPDQTRAVVGVLDDLARDRRRATHILIQIAAAERAMTRLWAIRFQETAP